MDAATIVRIVAGLLVIFVFLPVVIIPYWMIFKRQASHPRSAFSL